jgi:glycosyltransferase involved in cell wall biosynthesis
MSKPLVTFVVFSYNRERFIREAVRGALAQTYSPLEVIFSDDCSQDRTFEIIQEEVALYEGPHRVILNRNDRNLGIGGNINRGMKLAKGQLILTNADDDVSLGSRTEELVKVWSSGEVYYLHSDAIIIDEDGVGSVTLSDLVPTPPPVPVESWQEVFQQFTTYGCTEAWDRALFDIFGPLPEEDRVYEDRILPFRSALLGKNAYIDKPLVLYRQHHNNMSRIDAIRVNLKGSDTPLPINVSQFAKHQNTEARIHRTCYEACLRDTHLFLSIHPERRAELLQAKRFLEAQVAFQSFKLSTVESSRTERLRSCLRTIGKLKELGELKSTQVAKVCFLSLSPLFYYGMQKHYYWIKARYAKPMRRLGRFKGKFDEMFYRARRLYSQAS